MRVLQLIDSLRAGGAERVAVNIANELANRIEKSFLCSTREEGPLREELNENVQFFFLNRSNTLDFRAIKRLRNFVRINKIEVIHAHASSYFIATLIKFSLPKIRLIWHDHLGKRAEAKQNKLSMLNICSNYFEEIIAVNRDLAKWAEDNLNSRTVTYIPNFTVQSKIEKYTILEGVNDKRILYLANFRNPKNHLLLLQVFSDLSIMFSDWSLHLVGKDYNDSYSERIKDFINKNNLKSKVFILGQRKDVFHIINQCSIGVITSTNEGLPLTLLEYGLGGLAVVSTDVGQCKEVISDNGFVVQSQSESDLKNALKALMSNKELRTENGKLFNLHINQNYNAEKIIMMIMNAYI